MTGKELIKMNRKERVRAAILHRQTEKIPYHINYTPPVEKMLQEYYRVGDVDEAIGNHIMMVRGNDRRPLYADPSIYGDFSEDDFGVIWRNSPHDRGRVYRHPLTEPTLQGYNFPDSRRPGRFDGIGEEIRTKPDIFAVGVSGDLWERCYFLMSFTELIVSLYRKPSFVERLLDKLADYNVATIDELSRFPIDAVYLSDDYGHQGGLFMSPKHWCRFIKPRLKRIFDFARSKGLFTMLHSDGNILEIIPDLIEIGLDVLHPVQPEAMDVYYIKRKFGRDLCLWGGIGTQRLLNMGTPRSIRREVRKAKKILGEGGGYILAPSINLQRDCPLENILTLIQLARE